MRVLMNGIPMLGFKTGIGQYVERLARALAALPELEELGVFTGTQIVPAALLFKQLADGSRARRYEQLRQAARWFAPLTRPIVQRARRRCFAARARNGNWSVYHEPNYAPHRFAGSVVTTVCDLVFLRYPQFLPADRLAWLRSTMRKCMSRSHAIITISEFTRSELLDLWPQTDPERVFPTPLGVDGSRFHTRIDPESVSQLKRRYDLPDQFVLFLGTLEPRKNLHGLVDGYIRLPSCVQAGHPLVLAGAVGWNQEFFREKLAQLARSRRLLVLGYVNDEDVPALFSAATVFCFPSFYEGFGLPVLEAAACGVPVVCSRTAALPEVMADAAVYVDPDSPDSIAHGLLSVLTDAGLRERMRQTGLLRAAQFTWDKCARATLGVYRKVA